MIRTLLRACACAALAALLAVPPAVAQTSSRGGRKPAKTVTAEDHFRRDLPDPPGPGPLPPDHVVVKVGGRATTAREFARAYLDLPAMDRPGADSLGRVEFMKNLIRRDLLALEAARVDKPLTFEERHTLREFENRVHSNTLYQRLVIDPVRVTDAEVRAAYELMSREVRLRSIVVPSREQAEKLRRDLVAGRLGWATAVKAHSIGLKENDGDLGWLSASQIGFGQAALTHRLARGEISPPFRMRDGWEIVQAMEVRPATPPEFEAMRNLIRDQLEGFEQGRRADAMQDTLAAAIGLEVDTTNVRWAAKRFTTARNLDEQGQLTIDAAVPEFAPEDTGRVLVRHRDGRLTLGAFLHEYQHIPPMIRPNINEYSLLRSQAIVTALDPHIVELARRRGIPDDPFAKAQIARRLEQIRVERLYEDSVGAHVPVIPAAERRRHYEENRHRLVTNPSVTFAAITRSSRAGIDSVAARLAAGESAAAILRADSLAGAVSGAIHHRRMDEQGAPWHKLVFEDLRPGRHAVLGPDRQGDYVVIRLLTRDDGRELSYEEAQAWLDESLQNEHAERIFARFVERLARRHPASWRPDLVMRIELDPAARD